MKQFFMPLAEPLGALWCLMVLGSLYLLWRRQWRTAIWLGIPAILLFLLGSTSLAEALVSREERQWPGTASPTLSQHPADAVVSLGGGQRISRRDALGFAMGDGGSRILTAIELVRSGKARTLVLGGSWPMPGKANEPSMSVVQQWVTSWGLIGGGMTNLGICLTTHDEAVAFRRLKDSEGWQKVILVTSALHMGRSEALFKKQGIEVTPVAADFEVCGVSQDLPFSIFPRQRRLGLLALYMHEKIGWWFYRLKGWV